MNTNLPLVAELMTEFAERTGLGSPQPPRRYLWTDAFAVCTFLGLARATGEGRFFELALKLIAQVHEVLGRHREPPRAWLSGLDDAHAALHPTQGGLRIGKPLPERAPGEELDEAGEWERDGQSFHYLTRWMHALDQTARATAQAQFNRWALELADTAYARFLHEGRLAWKMSVNLSRPLVASPGRHDPLDGYVTVLQLRATADRLGAPAGSSERALAGFSQLIEHGDWRTDDALCLGGLFVDAHRLAQLAPGHPLAGTLLATGLDGVRALFDRHVFDQPLERRLAFRELGLAIGLHAAAALGQPRYQELHSIAIALEQTWAAPEVRRSALWREHLDINEVMLATALAPEGFLVLR